MGSMEEWSRMSASGQVSTSIHHLRSREAQSAYVCGYPGSRRDPGSALRMAIESAFVQGMNKQLTCEDEDD